MTITELIFPRVKPNQESVDEIERNWPTFAKALVDPNPGLYNAFRGWILSENERDVRNEFREILIFGELVLYRR